MSLFCLCVIENVKDNEKNFFVQQIEMLAKYHKRGVKFLVNWNEPIISNIKKDSLIINVLDCPKSDNCELFLLPDGWYSNGQTEKLSFKERIKLLQDITNVFINRKYRVDFYFGQSGTQPEDFLNIALETDDLADYLTKTIGINGVDDGLHIRIIR